MMKVWRAFAMGMLAAMILGASVSGARAGNQGSITVMTQNLYQGTELANTLAATTQQQFVLGVAADYNNVVATDFPERADAIAAEIAQTGPALVGLQEVALWQTQRPYLSGSWTVSYDFLQMLLDRLAAHGMHYTTVGVRTNFNVAGVGLFSFGYMGVSLTERAALLARTDLPTSQLQLSNPQQGGYLASILVHTLTGTDPIGSGWLSVDATTQGHSFRFITTHLSAITLTSGVQAPQMQELLAGPAVTTLPVVIAGDFNSTPTGAAYTEATGAGFADEWTVANGGDNGYTAFQVVPTITNTKSNLSTRIDYVLARGPIAAQDMRLVGATPSSRTPSGLWPADHAGVVATLAIGGQNG
jgi:endonuclease/exonuclease/phosphatase family metal-dependent hydrolase